MPDTITIPAMYIGTPDATLEVDSETGESYSMTLRAADGHIIASASGFRPGACQDFGSDYPERTAGTFGAFLSHALEDAEFAAEWDVLAEDASDWTDALTIMELHAEG